MTRMPKLDMSDPETLANFITQSTSTKAKRTALIFGGHGSIWFLETEPHSNMSMKQIKQAIQSSAGKVDLILFDTCLMSNVNALYDLRGVADIIVAHED